MIHGLIDQDGLVGGTQGGSAALDDLDGLRPTGIGDRAIRSGVEVDKVDSRGVCIFAGASAPAVLAEPPREPGREQSDLIGPVLDGISVVRLGIPRTKACPGEWPRDLHLAWWPCRPPDAQELARSRSPLRSSKTAQAQ